MPWKTKVPKPPPPISAATVTSPMFCTSTMRMPVRMTGNASGSFDVRARICQLVIPCRAPHRPRRATRAAGPATVLATTGSNEYRNSATTAGAAPMPRMPERGRQRHRRRQRAERRHQNAEQRDRRNGLDQIEHAQDPARSRGTRWHRTPERQRRPDARRRASQAPATGAGGLAREALGVDRVLAHHREVVEGAVRQAQRRDADEQHQQQHAHAAGPGRMPRDRIGRHQPSRDEQHPEARAGSDAHHLVAGGVSASPAAATANATTTTPSSAVASRARGLATHTAARLPPAHARR